MQTPDLEVEAKLEVDQLAPKLDVINGKVATVAPHMPEGSSTRKSQPKARNPRPCAKEKCDQKEAEESERKKRKAEDKKRMSKSLG